MQRSILAAGLFGCALLLTSSDGPGFNQHQKAYYLDPQQVAFVRPGLQVTILSAQIAPDGAIQTRFRITDPRGLPLDRQDVTTPGTVATSFVAAYIPRGQEDYVAYTTRPQTSPITGVTATQAAADTGGRYQQVGDGEYVYTFGTKAPAGFDTAATHSIGVYATRDLSEFDLGSQFSNFVFNFVPNGSPVTQVHDIVRTQTCNKCHDPLQAHGGARQLVELCVLCHTPQTTDPDTGNTVDFKVMVHKIHMGEELPSVQAGKPYQIIGFNQSVADFSDVVFPAVSPANCQVCHDPNSGAAQASVWLTQPTRAACGACHDNVNFATGENHVNLPQPNDNQCSTCHIPQGEREFDASIQGAHTIPRFSTQLRGVVFTLDRVDNGVAGRSPTVTFTVRDKSGAPINASDMNLLNLVLSYPTRDYSTAISEDARQAQTSGNGVYTYTMRAVLPGDLQGTAAIGIEGYRNATINTGTVQETTVRDVGQNKVTYFAAGGGNVQPRRQVVAEANCNQCHFAISAHGDIRNEVQYCVLCHNPNATDQARRPADQNPPESIDFRTMIHKIHTGEELQIPYVVYGFGNVANSFNDVLFPGDRRDCAKCHVNDSQQLPLPQGLLPVMNPRGFIKLEGPATAACLGCHTTQAAAAHAQVNGGSAADNPLGESCAVCHGSSAEFSVDRVHAR